MSAPTNHRCGKDRLSDLPDGVLGSILSYLPIKEAGRGAVLGRRWRHAFAGVDTLSFVQDEVHDNNDDSFTGDAMEMRSANGDFIDEVNAALLSRRRCGARAAPRTFRVNFGCYDWWDQDMLDRWLYYVLDRCSPELHLDLRLQHADLREHHVNEPYNGEGDGDCYALYDADVPADDRCPASYQHYNPDEYRLPQRLFSCVALRTLRLGACTLEPPNLIHLPFLDTLLLSAIKSTGDNIQRLISGCPRLVDLTLERCGYTDKYDGDPNPHKNFTIAVLDKRLQRLSLRCCHNLVRVSIDASELRTFEYRGAVPSGSLLALQQSLHKMSSCTIGLCGKKVYKEELPLFREFLQGFIGTRHLHLVSTHLGSGIGNEVFSGFPYFSNLDQLELTGYLGGRSIKAVTRMLQLAPNIEILSLFMKPSIEGRYYYELSNEPGARLGSTALNVSIPCLRNRVRRINLVHYQGDEAHRYVAKLLLCNAMVLEQVCLVLPRGAHEVQARLKKEIEGWLVNKSAKTIFL
ncbi:hypothetical protein D1007_22221 [Hordeum vulgare]|uniref:At1g61320/AtMIF1 LRR domain-containing protein n=1 Tax=Hordeum vulgare subsp. vulgare TaxID=112509 RepID=A0A8I7B234_HORVV|nr:hypothetical protein D1007_22221 [Hordeum vulgare]